MIAATNIIENLDEALVRPGRFDRSIKVELPNPVERSKIFAIHLKDKAHNLDEQDIKKAAVYLDNCSGAEIENFVNLLALHAVRKA